MLSQTRKLLQCKVLVKSSLTNVVNPVKIPKELGSTLCGEVDRYNGVTVELDDAKIPKDAKGIHNIIADSLEKWRKEKRAVIWLHIPIKLSHVISPAAELGFTFHNAEGAKSVLKLWIGATQDRTPRFATHQVGVSGLVLHEPSGQVLVVKDKKSMFQNWKFPGGLSDLGEDIGETAVREVFEETGIYSEFRSVLGVRQQHSQPGAFGRSDFYFVCRLHALSTNINMCTDEISHCEWIDIQKLNDSSEITSITRRMTELLLYGMKHGFHTVDITFEEMRSVYKGLFYKLYHRPFMAEKGSLV